MTRCVLAQCSLRVALRRRFAARPAPPVRVHRLAARSAADTASFSFGFRDDEAAAPAADPTFGELARAVEVGNVDAVVDLLAATPLPASRKAAATDSCTRLVAELCRRGRVRDAERAFQAAASQGAWRVRAVPPRALTPPQACRCRTRSARRSFARYWTHKKPKALWPSSACCTRTRSRRLHITQT